MGNSSINTSVSGMKAYNKQLEAISGNVANAETTTIKHENTETIS